MSFFDHEGPPTAEDYLTDEENEVGPVIGGHGCYDRDILNNSVVLLESKEDGTEITNTKMNNIIKTVRRNFEGWTKREIGEAKFARTLQPRVGNMRDAKLKQMASVNGLKNAPVHPEHVTNATRILAPTQQRWRTNMRGDCHRGYTRMMGYAFLTTFTACTTVLHWWLMFSSRMG